MDIAKGTPLSELFKEINPLVFIDADTWDDLVDEWTLDCNWIRVGHD